MGIFIKYAYISLLISIFLGIGVNGFGQVRPVPIPPRYAPKYPPAVPVVKPITTDLTQLQNIYQDLRAERDRLEKEIDIVVGKIRQVKNDFRKADNPVSKYFYRRQLETHFAGFREKVDQLRIVETRLSTIMRELGKRISIEPGIPQPNPLPHPIPLQNQPPRLRPILPPERVLEPELVTIPPEFYSWSPEERTQYLQEQIQRISEEKKQLENTIQRHQKDLSKLKKLLEENQPTKPKSTTP